MPLPIPGGSIPIPRISWPGENAPPNDKTYRAGGEGLDSYAKKGAGEVPTKGQGKKEEREKKTRKKTIKEHWERYRNPRDPYEKENKRKEIRKLIEGYRERFGRN